VKIALLFFLLITHVCGAPASWATRHTTVCLDHILYWASSNMGKSWGVEVGKMVVKENVYGCIRPSYRPFRSQAWLKLEGRGLFNITGLYSHLQVSRIAFTSLTACTVY